MVMAVVRTKPAVFGIGLLAALLRFRLNPRLVFRWIFSMVMMIIQHFLIPLLVARPIIIAMNINDSYTGISGKLGATYAATNWLNLGAVIRFPTSLSIDQSSSTSDGGNISNGEFSYRYTLPFSFGLGSEFNIRDLTLAADISYLDYTQLSYQKGFEDLSAADRLVRQYYRDVLSYHLGAEYLIRSAGISLRAGYFSEPIPLKDTL